MSTSDVPITSPQTLISPLTPQPRRPRLLSERPGAHPAPSFLPFYQLRTLLRILHGCPWELLAKLCYLYRDIQVLKTYGAAPYGTAIKNLEKQIKEKQQSVDEKIGVKESDTGLAPPHLWDVAADRQRMSEEQPLQVAR